MKKTLQELSKEKLLAMARACRHEMRSHAMAWREESHPGSYRVIGGDSLREAYLGLAKSYRDHSRDYYAMAHGEPGAAEPVYAETQPV